MCGCAYFYLKSTGSLMKIIQQIGSLHRLNTQSLFNPQNTLLHLRSELCHLTSFDQFLDGTLFGDFKSFDDSAQMFTSTGQLLELTLVHLNCFGETEVDIKVFDSFPDRIFIASFGVSKFFTQGLTFILQSLQLFTFLLAFLFQLIAFHSQTLHLFSQFHLLFGTRLNTVGDSSDILLKLTFYGLKLQLTGSSCTKLGVQFFQLIF
mmetsp:Transcript_9010/g.27889  ORF Transcript_9010/g.27889 Transcript_9010/m.27889 type:complete len:206 (-) Transcript_9010:291-908(-)